MDVANTHQNNTQVEQDETDKLTWLDVLSKEGMAILFLAKGGSQGKKNKE